MLHEALRHRSFKHLRLGKDKVGAHQPEICFLGAGSAVAFGKLHGILPSKPTNLPGKNLINISLAAGNVAAATAFLTTGDTTTGLTALAATTALGGTMGAHMTASIGGQTSDLTHCMQLVLLELWQYHTSSLGTDKIYVYWRSDPSELTSQASRHCSQEILL